MPHPNDSIRIKEQGWRELLTLTYLKAGPESAGWQEQLSILEQLMLWLQEPAAEDEGEDGVDSRDVVMPAFANAHTHIGDSIAKEAGAGLSLDELVAPGRERIRAVLSGDQPVQWRPNPWSGAAAEHGSELMHELEAANPHLTRWFKRARGFRVGEQFNYLGDRADHQPLTLAWISDDNRHFVFVNNRGQKVFDFDIVDLPVDEYLTKPIGVKELRRVVEEILYRQVGGADRQEFLALVSRRIALENRYTERELDDHPEYAGSRSPRLD